jgi:hypothetical protein
MLIIPNHRSSPNATAKRRLHFRTMLPLRPEVSRMFDTFEDITRGENDHTGKHWNLPRFVMSLQELGPGRYGL